MSHSVISSRGSQDAGLTRLWLPKCIVLQVREAIMTSALLRLPRTMPRALKAQRVDQILSQLVTYTHKNPELKQWRCSAA